MAIFRSSVAGGKWATTTSWEEETAPGVWTPAVGTPGIADTVNLVKAGGTIEVATATTAEAKSVEANASGNEYEKTLKLTTSANLKTAGSLILSTAMTLNVGTGIIEVTNTSGTATVNFQGKEGQKFTQNGTGGTVKLTGAMPLAGALLITAGTFDTNGQEVTCTTAKAEASTTVKLGASTIICTSTGANTWSMTETTTVEAGTSTIEFTNASESGKTFKGAGKTYYTLTFASDNCEVTGANTFTIIRLNTRGKSVKGTTFEKSVAQTVTEFITNATLTERIKVESTTSGKPWKLKAASGLIEVKGVELKDATAEGGAAFIARGYPGTVNTSGNSGWQFPEEVWYDTSRMGAVSDLGSRM